VLSPEHYDTLVKGGITSKEMFQQKLWWYVPHYQGATPQSMLLLHLGLAKKGFNVLKLTNFSQLRMGWVGSMRAATPIGGLQQPLAGCHL
jgi:hypothetical protein